MNSLKPSHFTSFPSSSTLQNWESERIALNSMMIRARIGDVWELSWETYKAERLKDRGFTESEKAYFDEVIPLISDPIGAISFAPAWAQDARKVVN